MRPKKVHWLRALAFGTAYAVGSAVWHTMASRDFTWSWLGSAVILFAIQVVLFAVLNAAIYPSSRATRTEQDQPDTR